MKKYLVLALTAATLWSCGDPNAFTISGTIEGLEGTVYLSDSKHNVIDSVAVVDGSFTLEGITALPAINYVSDVRKGRSKAISAMVIVEPAAQINITKGESGETVVVGSPANDARNDYTVKMQALFSEYGKKDITDERRAQLEKEYEQINLAAKEQNRNNLFSAMTLQRELPTLSSTEAYAEIALLSEAVQQSEFVTKLKEEIALNAKTEVGKTFINIVQPTPDNKPLSLSSVINNEENKYTLVDFWASWCGPCIGEMPHLTKTYKEFSSKGFEIYAVSLDNNRTKWLDCIKEYKMNWLHVSELRGFDCKAVNDYAVRGIPSNVLIDSEGKIVAKNLRGEDLYNKVAELLK